MPPVTHNTPAAELNLTLEEQWAVHVALLEYIEVAVQPESKLSLPDIELSLLEKLEVGDSLFTVFELERLQQECEFYAKSKHIPPRDRVPIHKAIQKIDQLVTATLQ